MSSVWAFLSIGAIAWLRAAGLALFVLAVAPGTAELFEELACAATGSECCDGDCCDSGAWDDCSKSCLHCACCPHATAMLGGGELGLAPELGRHCAPLGALPGAEVRGYRAPPFRPPLA